MSSMIAALLVAAMGSSLARGDGTHASTTRSEISRCDILPMTATATPSSTMLRTATQTTQTTTHAMARSTTDATTRVTAHATKDAPKDASTHATSAATCEAPMHIPRSACTPPVNAVLASHALHSNSMLASRASGFVNASLTHPARGAMLIDRSAGTPIELDASALLSAREEPALRFGETIATHAGMLAIGTPTDGDDAALAGRVAVGRVHRDARGAISFVRDGELIGNTDGGHFACALAFTSVRSSVVGAPSDPRANELLAVGADRAGSGALLAGSVELYCAHGAQSRASEDGDDGALTWTHEATIVATHPQEGAEFGHAIDFTNAPLTMIAIGAPRTEVDGVFDAGAVHLFTRAEELQPEHAHSPQPATDAISTQSDDGATPAATNASINSCNTRVRWRELHVLHAPIPNMSASFGAAVALGESVLAVGSPRERVDDELVAEGAVHLFAFDQVSARVIHTFRAPRTDRARAFGASLSIDGTTLAIGAPLLDGNLKGSEDGGDDGLLNAVGAVYLVDLTDLDAPMRRVDCPAPTAGAGFGHSVVLAGNMLLVGAPGIEGVSPDSTGRPLIEDLGTAWVIDTSTLRATHRLRAPSLQPSSLFGTVGAIMRAAPEPDAPPLLFMGHLYVEEEAFGPSPGVGVFALP